MDFSKFLLLLKKEYREILFSIIFGFPLAYLDCWFMYPIFRDWDIIPQILVATGICVIAISIGVVFSLLVSILAFGVNLKDFASYLNLILIVFPLVATSGYTILNDVHSKFRFASAFLIVCGFLMGVGLVFFICKKCKKNKGEDTK